MTRPRKKKVCYRRCKILMWFVLAFLAVFMFMGASWYVHRLHREAERPPCVYGDEHEDCDREKSKLWLEWLEKSLWMMEHRGEERGRGKSGHRSGLENDTRERPLHREDDNHMDPFIHMMREFRQEMEERYQEMDRDGVHPPPPPTSPPPPPM
ncbi:uncharacterized protein LOC118414848 [Branchiostoma floridae]|nr:uncharacterized protein LOC118414848 [Branchiostoma floridae]